MNQKYKNIKTKEELYLAIREEDFDTPDLEYIDENLLEDENMMQDILWFLGAEAFKYAHTSLKKDNEFILSLIKETGYGLQYATKEQRADREIVKMAIKNDGLALEFVDERLKKDREIVVMAIEDDINALKFADASFRKDRDIVMIALENHGDALEFADESLKKDRDMVMMAIKTSYGEAFKFADKSGILHNLKNQ